MGKTMSILCSIGTRGRYDTTLPLAITSVMNQTLKPDRLVIFDDNDEPEDLRKRQLYKFLFQMLEIKGIPWSVEIGDRKGPHYNHQRANKMGYDWVWRVDDDNIVDPDTLEKLYRCAITYPEPVGAVGGSILTPPSDLTPNNSTGLIKNITREYSVQWAYIEKTKEVEHLHCSFLYRAGINDFDLSLSRIGHREETLFTYELIKKGYKVLVTPAVTWHLRSGNGGIRGAEKEVYDHDENIFWKKTNFTVVVLDNGMGDHIVFKKVLPDIKNPLVFSCYPEIVPGMSISEAKYIFGDLSQFSVYAKMDQWNWKGTLEEAFRVLYNAPKQS